jgi:hypothetical protein
MYVSSVHKPPDGVLFGDPLSVTTDKFVDREEDLSDVYFHAFDAVLQVPGSSLIPHEPLALL